MSFTGCQDQVLVFEKKVKEVTLIEHTMYGEFNNDQISGIKEVNQSYGWGKEKTHFYQKERTRKQWRRSHNFVI